MTIRVEIWECCASPATDFSSMLKKSNRSLRRKPGWGLLLQQRAYWWPASAIFFWATTALAWRSSAAWPAANFREGVQVTDFGIRGFDLAYALQDGYETTILVDAYPHGQAPGTVSLVEPDLSNLDSQPQSMVDAHAMNPMNVLRMATAMNGKLGKVLLVGCEPQTFGPEEGQLGLSECVEASVNGAVDMVVSAVNKALRQSGNAVNRST